MAGWMLPLFSLVAVAPGVLTQINIELKINSPIQEGKNTSLKCITNSSSTNWLLRKISVKSRNILKIDGTHREWIDVSLKKHWKTKAIAPTMKNLTILIANVECKDHGKYSCETTNSLGHFHSESTKLDVLSKPTEIEITTFPVLKGDIWKSIPGTNLKVLCKGNVGNPAGDFLWYVAAVDPAESFKEDSYKLITSNITNSPPKMKEDSCYYERHSILIYHPMKEMNLAFRCQVSNKLYNPLVKMRVVHIRNKEEESSNVGRNVAIALGVIIPEIILAIVLGVILYKRRKQQKKRLLEREEAEMNAVLFSRKDKETQPIVKTSSTTTSSKGGRRSQDSKNATETKLMTDSKA